MYQKKVHATDAMQNQQYKFGEKIQSIGRGEKRSKNLKEPVPCQTPKV